MGTNLNAQVTSLNFIGIESMMEMLYPAAKLNSL